MSKPLHQKSTVEEIRDRFDKDVERFSQLEMGQVVTMDAPLAMELITQAAVASTSPIKKVLDIGCGAGNNTIKLREALGHDFNADLLDISQPMINRSVDRLSAVNGGTITPINSDCRDIDLTTESLPPVAAFGLPI